jgi:hypothetical protein
MKIERKMSLTTLASFDQARNPHHKSKKRDKEKKKDQGWKAEVKRRADS